MLEKLVRLTLLYDFYGPLLTDKQQQFFELYYHQDLSLAEIAQRFEVSRQAVYDLLRRAESALEEYETKLQLIQRFWDRQAKMEQLVAIFARLDEDFKRWLSDNDDPVLVKSVLDGIETGRNILQRLAAEG